MTTNQPGPELDAEVQRIVFKSDVFLCTDVIHGSPCPIWRYRVRPEDEPEHVSAEPGVPRYSTDITAAIAVLNAWPYDWWISREAGCYTVTLCRHETPHTGKCLAVSRESLPLAIVLVRLKAKQWEEERHG